MSQLLKLALEDVQSAYDRLSNALEMSRESKDGNESKIMDSLNRLNECISHVNTLVSNLPQDTVSDETVQMKAVKKNG